MLEVPKDFLVSTEIRVFKEFRVRPVMLEFPVPSELMECPEKMVCMALKDLRDPLVLRVTMELSESADFMALREKPVMMVTEAPTDLTLPTETSESQVSKEKRERTARTVSTEQSVPKDLKEIKVSREMLDWLVTRALKERMAKMEPTEASELKADGVNKVLSVQLERTESTERTERTETTAKMVLTELEAFLANPD